MEMRNSISKAEIIGEREEKGAMNKNEIKRLAENYILKWRWIYPLEKSSSTLLLLCCCSELSSHWEGKFVDAFSPSTIMLLRKFFTSHSFQ